MTDRPIESQPLPDVREWSDRGQPNGAIIEPALPGSEPPPANLGARADVAGLQVLLDRAGASPGVIDGRFGSNVDKAIIAYRELTGENLKSTDAEGIKRALAASGGD
ncbi:peptidoglycan-binding protein, partial [Rhizobiaceae sp. 2RAB30]